MSKVWRIDIHEMTISSSSKATYPIKYEHGELLYQDALASDRRWYRLADEFQDEYMKLINDEADDILLEEP